MSVAMSSSSPSKTTSAPDDNVVGHSNDQSNHFDDYEIDFKAYATDSSWLLPSEEDTPGGNNVPPANEAVASTTMTTATNNVVGDTSTVVVDEEELESDFRSFLNSTLLPAVSRLAPPAQDAPTTSRAYAVPQAEATNTGIPTSLPPPHVDTVIASTRGDKPTQIFTPEAEQAELETLTVDEILDAEADLHGLVSGMDGLRLGPDDTASSSSRSTTTTANIREDPVAAPCDLAALELALLALPPETKRYYLEACVRCPAEVTDEHKAAFLETEQLDPHLAALRLCTYWSVRVSTFGEQLAYLPMTLSGAMRQDVDTMIRHCPMQRLPRPDLYGRLMTFWDSGRRDTAKCTIQQEHRGMFYQVHTMTLDPTSRRRGWVAIASGKNQNQSNFSWETATYLKGFFSTVMPIKMRSCHVSHPSNVLYYGIYPLLKGVIGRDMRLRWKLYPSNTTDEELMEQLATYGIPRSRLPVDIGGELRLDFEQFVADYSVVESLRDMDETSKKEEEAAAAATALTTNAASSGPPPPPPRQPFVASIMAHPQLAMPSSYTVQTATGSASSTSQQRNPSRADDMLTEDTLIMSSMQPTLSRTGNNSEVSTARAQIVNSFNSQLLRAAGSLGSRSISSKEDEHDDSSHSSSGGGGCVDAKPLGLGLLTSSLSVTALPMPQAPAQPNVALANPWSMLPTSMPEDVTDAVDDDDLDSFDYDLDEFREVGNL